MTISAKKWTPLHHEKARKEHAVLFKWEMDKRYVADENDRSVIQCCGTISLENARKIWAIIQDYPTLTPPHRATGNGALAVEDGLPR